MKSRSVLRFWEFLKINSRLVAAVAIATGLLVVLQMFVTRSPNQECLGVADAKETIISYEYPVRVKRLYVIPGQKVRRGQPLIEVDPAQLNGEILALQTELKSLESESAVRESLLSTFDTRDGVIKPDASPLTQSIEGLRRQLAELLRQKADSIRFAEDDGIVGSVSYRPNEQVRQFEPILTLIPTTPTLVFGFIHENRLAEFRVGDQVEVEPIADSSRGTVGRVASLGGRITAFPERFQAVPMRPTHFGRELVLTLPSGNRILVGEKVRIQRTNGKGFSDLGFQAFAESRSSRSPQAQSISLAKSLPMELGALLYIQATKSLLAASDDDGPSGSPFWLFNSADWKKSPRNLIMKPQTVVDDVESLSESNGSYYAMGSLSLNKNGEVKPKRNRLIRFELDELKGTVTAVRMAEIRAPILDALGQIPALSRIYSTLHDLDVEGFSMRDGQGYMGIKSPQMLDGSSLIIRVNNLAAQLESSKNGQIGRLSVDLVAMVRLDVEACDSPARISDLMKMEKGLLILGNCQRAEKMGQVWHLMEGQEPRALQVVAHIRSGRPEGMVFGASSRTLMISSDNGAKGSDLIELEIPNF